MARALRLVAGPRARYGLARRDGACPPGTDLVVLPGGFSYGDYLRCGAIAAHAPVMEAVRAHAARGGLVLGVCNGFQILCEAGLLPGVLMRNRELALHLPRRVPEDRALRHAVHARLQCRPGDPRAGRARRRQLLRRTRDDRADRRRGPRLFRYTDAGRPASTPTGT